MAKMEQSTVLGVFTEEGSTLRSTGTSCGNVQASISLVRSRLHVSASWKQASEPLWIRRPLLRTPRRWTKDDVMSIGPPAATSCLLSRMQAPMHLSIRCMLGRQWMARFWFWLYKPIYAVKLRDRGAISHHVLWNPPRCLPWPSL